MAYEAGQCLLVNIEDSLRERLVGETFVADFFRSCASAFDPVRGSAPKDVSRLVDDARMGNLPGALRPLVRENRVTKASWDGSRWSTTVTWHGFFAHHLDFGQVSRRGLPIPPQVRLMSRESVNTLLDAMQQRAPQWWQAAGNNGGHLGMPPELGSTCWVSSADSETSGAKSPWSEPTDADGANFSLGLGCELDACLLRYHFDATSARIAAKDDVARPTFADLGNKWFRVRDVSPRGRHHAEWQWGTTAHIGAENTGTRPHTKGCPERTVQAMPIGLLSGLTIEFLGLVKNANKTIDQQRHLANMLGRRKISAVHGRLKRLLKRFDP